MDEYNQNYEPYSTASMICGICSIVTCFCYGIVGLILGIFGVVLHIKSRKYNDGMPNGKALAGLICGIIGIVLSILMICYLIYVLLHYDSMMELMKSLGNLKR